jgi:hypothetical protein
MNNYARNEFEKWFLTKYQDKSLLVKLGVEERYLHDFVKYLWEGFKAGYDLGSSDT